MLMMYEVVILHEFGKVQGLSTSFLRTRLFGPKRSPASLPSKISLAVAKTRPFAGFFLKSVKQSLALPGSDENPSFKPRRKRGLSFSGAFLFDDFNDSFLFGICPRRDDDLMLLLLLF